MTPTELISTGGAALSAKDREIRAKDGQGKQTGDNSGGFETEMRRSDPQKDRSKPEANRASDDRGKIGHSADTVDARGDTGKPEKTSVSNNDAAGEKQVPAEFSTGDAASQSVFDETAVADTVDMTAVDLTPSENAGETTNKIITVEENSHEQTAIPAVEGKNADAVAAAEPEPQQNLTTDPKRADTESADIDPSRLVDGKHEPSGTAAREAGNDADTAQSQPRTSVTDEFATLQPDNGRLDQTGVNEVKTTDAPAINRAAELSAAQVAAPNSRGTTSDQEAPLPTADKTAVRTDQTAPAIMRETTPAQIQFMAQSQAAAQSGKSDLSISAAPTVQVGEGEVPTMDVPPPDVDVDAVMAKPATAAVVTAQAGLNLMADGQEAITLSKPASQPLQVDVQTSMNRTDTQTGQILRPVPVPEQITVAVGQAKDAGRIEMRLDPPDLGKVQIQLNTSEDGVRAVIMAEKTETQDLLRRHAELLSRDLRESGFEGIELEFADSSGMTGQEAGEEMMAMGDTPSGPNGEPVQQTPAQILRTALQSGLDIRL